MAKKTSKGLERVEIKLHPTVRKKIKAKADKKIPPVSPKRYIEQMVTEHVQPSPTLT